jgi:hypothetical protein
VSVRRSDIEKYLYTFFNCDRTCMKELVIWVYVKVELHNMRKMAWQTLFGKTCLVKNKRTGR